jgi:hypothetical protein
VVIRNTHPGLFVLSQAESLLRSWLGYDRSRSFPGTVPLRETVSALG